MTRQIVKLELPGVTRWKVYERKHYIATFRYQKDARAFVALRDLLEACKAMEIALSEVPCISNKQEASRIQARQAIRKAEGKE